MNYKNGKNFIISAGRSGQILTELLIAVAVVAVVAAFGAQIVTVSFLGGETAKERGAALRLAQEAVEAARAIAHGNDSQSQGWNRIYKPPDGAGDPSSSKGSANPYYPALSGSPQTWVLNSGAESVTLNGEIYTRKIIIENVSRDASGDIESVYNGANDDPATQKITAVVSKTGAPDTAITEYLTRFFNDSGPQTDWQGAAGCGAVGATSSPNYGCVLNCITGSSTPGSFKLPSSC